MALLVVSLAMVTVVRRLVALLRVLAVAVEPALQVIVPVVVVLRQVVQEELVVRVLWWSCCISWLSRYCGTTDEAVCPRSPLIVHYLSTAATASKRLAKREVTAACDARPHQCASFTAK